jgi:anti-sigma factor RsiW
VQGVLGDRLARCARTPAPKGLHDRVAARLTTEPVVTLAPSPPRRRLRWLAGGGALLAAAAVLVLFVTAPDVPGHIAQPLVQEAQRGATALTLATEDYSQLQAWFEDRVGYAVHIPEIADANLVGGRLTELAGIQTVAVLYLYHDAPITYFAWPTATVMGSEVPGDRIVSASADGHELAVWTERGYARAVVAAMPKGDVMGFAIECRAKAMMSRTT